jgi:hypothetical protein
MRWGATKNAVAVYRYLRESLGTVVAVEELTYAVRDGKAVTLALQALEDLHLIHRFGHFVAVFPVYYPGEMQLYEQEEIFLWLQSAEQEVSLDGELNARPIGDMEKLLTLYEACQKDRGRVAPDHDGQSRMSAMRLCRGSTYEQLRPWLVFFLFQPEHFQNLKDRVERFGMSLLTFEKNLNAISQGCAEASHTYGPDRYWQRHLRGDLERFLS